MFVFSRGDIFSSKASALVNPVNCLPVMGAGLALQMRHKIPGLFDAHCRAARAGELAPGHLHFFQALNRGQIIIGFPSKRHWKDPSRLEDIEAGLAALRSFLQQNHQVQSVAIPQIGCGLGGLAWAEVLPAILRQLAGLPQTIEVFGPGPD